MNKAAIQRFAIWARTELIAQVSQRAYQYGITKDGYGDANAVTVGGRVLSADEQRLRKELVEQIRRKGYTQVMEEVAYTWFNRFIALRFMEVNNYLPSHIRVFSDSTGAFKPEILNDVLHLDLPGLNADKIAEFIEGNQTEALYRYLLLSQCNALNDVLPQMFEKMGGYTELLLPNNILKQDSILGHMVTDIPEEDWMVQVQIIGWLYQYYNSELKDDTFALLKKNVKITKERIPSATQLFTPDWIVRYMVENSLGRIFIDKRKNEGVFADGRGTDEMTWEETEAKRIANEKTIAEQMGWKYYLPEAEQTKEVRQQLDEIQREYGNLDVKEIKVIDPCMGSGHILVYAFDVLMQIYEANGYSQRDAAQSILENNLYGLDIDDRAAQLAYFAVMMKARQYDRRIFSRGIQPHVHSIMETNVLGDSYQLAMGDFLLSKEHQETLNYLLDAFLDAKEYGSILQLEDRDYVGLMEAWKYTASQTAENVNMTLWYSAVEHEIPKLIEQAIIMSQKYDAVVTNPPYMGSAGMGNMLTDFVKQVYPETKSDLSTVFMEKTLSMCSNLGYMGMINIPVWMFITSYEKMRNRILHNNTIQNMLHLGRGVFGSDFGTTAFIIRKKKVSNYVGLYQRLFERQGAVDPVEKKEQWFFENRGLYKSRQDYFFNIPGSPIAYWVSNRFIDNFRNPHIESTHFSGGRNKTHNNEKYTRMWWEIADRERWQLYVKGGNFRRWYGNHEVVVDWSDEAKAEYDSHGGLYNQEYSGKTGICWTLITSAKTAFRIKTPNAHYDSGAPTIFNSSFTLDKVVLGLLNSNVATEYLSLMNPTINMGNTYVLSLPNIDVGCYRDRICAIVDENIAMCKSEWDSYELSMDFTKHPLICSKQQSLLRDCEKSWREITIQWFSQLQKNEKDLNKFFVDVYGLSGEISDDVPDRDVSIRLSNEIEDVCSLISYAVGCLFGRYSLDVPGLAYAGGEWDASKYSTILPDPDNIIPICDDDYFDDDITGRFVKWVETVYGQETLEANLKFIADALGGKGTPREVIRHYFINDFYADHLKIYQKRPIYWLFDSGKKNGFKALIYMHRYQSDLLARMRTDYVHEQQERYRTQFSHLADAIDHASASERVKLTKQQKKLQEQAFEILKYEEKVHHLADQNIQIDLDDGVKHNFELFADVLAKIK